MNKKIYLDYNATTPVDPAVQKTMNPYFNKQFGNSMSLHYWGQEARVALDESRQTMAKIIKANPEEIIFTGSATESNNLAIKGLALANNTNSQKQIITSTVEHPSVLESVDWLKERGVEITKVGVNSYGLVNPPEIERVIKKETILVSIIHASNEIGTIQPISEIGRLCREKGVYFHIDATQTLGKLPIDVEEMKVDLLTASAHKIYGPKGVGLLFLRRGLKITPLLHGGGQEQKMRGGTVNVAGVVGFAKAGEVAVNLMEEENKRISQLRDELIGGVLKIKGAHLNGHPQKRIANNANFWFSFLEGESLAILLSLKGIAVSTGSACSSDKLQPSPVLLAIGLNHSQAHGSLRVSLGRWTTREEINYFIKALIQSINQLRKTSPFK